MFPNVYYIYDSRDETMATVPVGQCSVSPTFLHYSPVQLFGAFLLVQHQRHVHHRNYTHRVHQNNSYQLSF